jgi:hypothetical protein
MPFIKAATKASLHRSIQTYLKYKYDDRTARSTSSTMGGRRSVAEERRYDF